MARITSRRIDAPGDSPAPPPSLRFERRMTDRWAMEAAATAFELGGADFGRMHELKIIDASDAGVGAISRTVLEPGAVVSLGFAAPGRIARRGVVLRCEPCGEGYRIAIEFEARMAA